MRYLLPEGTISASAGGLTLEADEDGFITVPDDAHPDVTGALESRHGLNLRPVLEAPQTVAAEPASASMRDAKKAGVALLRALGVPVEGRCTFEWLRRKLLVVLADHAPATKPAAVKPIEETPPEPAAEPAAEPTDEPAVEQPPATQSDGGQRFTFGTGPVPQTEPTPPA